MTAEPHSEPRVNNSRLSEIAAYLATGRRFNDWTDSEVGSLVADLRAKTEADLFGRAYAWKAWAIDTNDQDNHGLLGRYYFGTPHQFHEGCTLALFPTRKVAKTYLELARREWPKARIVRVSVAVTRDP